MLLTINHRTRYRYDGSAADVIQALRLTPGPHDGQHIRNWRIDADIDGCFRDSTDAFGNRVTMFYADRPVREVTIIVTGEAEMTDTVGMVRAHEPLPPAIFLRSTPLTAPDPVIAALAGRFAGGTKLAALHGLCDALFAEMRFEIGATDARTTAAAALSAGHGVCQDFAHIFIAAARHLGVPARYVSGHLARTQQQEAAHAWAEALVPDLGWIAFDPANGICATDSYLRVAVGLDYLDAAPIRGARRGGGGEHLSVTVDAEAAMRQSQS
ncbi:MULTISPECIES: transglutaminase family protein [Sphingomonas]|uniref:transglutaminase family protein n=1 Tax=Sphingomonas TaxID=13687 RepID=UPI000836122C|nr:transglutaminase family protein [Sphingomonas sp. CCH10-B3]